MKKLVFMFAAVVAMSFASCGNASTSNVIEDKDTLITDTLAPDTVVIDTFTIDTTTIDSVKLNFNKNISTLQYDSDLQTDIGVEN